MARGSSLPYNQPEGTIPERKEERLLPEGRHFTLGGELDSTG